MIQGAIMGSLLVYKQVGGHDWLVRADLYYDRTTGKAVAYYNQAYDGAYACDLRGDAADLGQVLVNCNTQAEASALGQDMGTSHVSQETVALLESQRQSMQEALYKQIATYAGILIGFHHQEHKDGATIYYDANCPAENRGQEKGLCSYVVDQDSDLSNGIDAIYMLRGNDAILIEGGLVMALINSALH